jgi:hypothetical protein
MPTNAYRSSGRPEVTYAIERVVDEGHAGSGSTASHCAA